MSRACRRINGKDFANLARHDETLWKQLLGARVEHAIHGSGHVTCVEHRINYAPLITLTFGNVQKAWPPRSFESGKTEILLESNLEDRVDAVFTELAEKEQAALAVAQREAERLAAAQEAARIESERWNSLTPEEQHREFMEVIAMRHRQRLERLGFVFKGIRPADHSMFHRVSHCYECGEELDNAVDVECRACNWILCGCGACGCGYSKRK